jgi:hypothetical protein
VTSAAQRAKRRVCAAFVMAVMACGGRAERAESADEGNAGAPGSGQAGAGASGVSGVSGDEVVLVLPVVPREESALPVMLGETDTGFEAFPEWTVSLALGEPYPASVRFGLEDGFMLRQDGRLLTELEGLTLRAANAPSAALGVALVDGNHFELTAREVGDFTVTLEGDWVPATSDAPSERAFSIELTVEVRRAASVVWHPCVTTPLRMIAGAPFQMAWHELLDEDGMQFSPANAEGSNNVEFTVRAAPGTTLTAEEGLASLVADGPEQTIEVQALNAQIGSFELVHLDSADGLEARFFFAADWMRGTTELFPGGTAHAPRPGQDPGHIGVAPTLSVGGVNVCSAAQPEWFEVRSETPSTCSETGERGCGEACSLSALPVVVLAESPGICELAVSAPASNGGLGTTAGLSVELVQLQ